MRTRFDLIVEKLVNGDYLGYLSVLDYGGIDPNDQAAKAEQVAALSYVQWKFPMAYARYQEQQATLAKLLQGKQ